MRCLAVFLTLAAAAASAAYAAEPFRLSLENVPIGELPPGWTAAKTGEGPGSVWKVVEDATAPAGGKALAQTSAEGPKKLFNLCVADKTQLPRPRPFRGLQGRRRQDRPGGRPRLALQGPQQLLPCPNESVGE